MPGANRGRSSLSKRSSRLVIAIALVLGATMIGAVPASAATGPHLVKDIKAGSRASNPTELTAVGNNLFFSAKGPKGRELWKSNGTAAGTSRVKNIYPGDGSSNPYELTNVGGVLFFAANNGVHGVELWKSDGTAAGTTMVEDITPGTAGYLASFTSVGGTLFFFRMGTSQELWKSNGTAAGTSLVEVVEPSEPYYGSPEPLLVEGSSLFFSVRDQSGQSQIWKSDGSPAGTRVVNFTDWAFWLIKLDGMYYFTRPNATFGIELWKSDGTLGGTELVEDINTSVECGGPPTCSADADKPVVLNGVMYFGAWVGGYDTRSLFRSNGTEAGTWEVKPLHDVTEITRLGNRLVMGAESELWRSNGTAQGTALVKAIGTIESFGGYPHGFVKVGSRLYFAANDQANPFNEGNEELWRTDGTTAGTKLVMDIDPEGASRPQALTNVNGSLYFTANDGTHGRELWRYVP
jgi:ELWxxDGT repeat protein